MAVIVSPHAGRHRLQPLQDGPLTFKVSYRLN